MQVPGHSQQLSPSERHDSHQPRPVRLPDDSDRQPGRHEFSARSRGRKTLIGRGTGLPHFTARPALLARARRRSLQPDGWVIRDAESRNGTLVNGQKIDEATVVDGNTIRVGSAEFEFHETEEPPTAKGDDPQLMQTIVQDMPIAVAGDARRSAGRFAEHRAGQGIDAAVSAVHPAAWAAAIRIAWRSRARPVAEADERGGRRVSFGQRRGQPAAEAGDPARRGRPRDAQRIAHRAGFAAGPRRVGRQSDGRPESGHAGSGAFRRRRLLPRSCAAIRRRTDDARRDSRLSRGRPVPPIRFRLHHLGGQHRGDCPGAGPRARRRCKAITSGWSRSRPVTTN